VVEEWKKWKVFQLRQKAENEAKEVIKFPENPNLPPNSI
jgi:hypothetical protein